jgi:hypothetical protein
MLTRHRWAAGTVLAGLAFLGAAGARAAPSNTATFTGVAQATVAQPTRLIPLEDLRFGRFIRPITASTITLAPDGVVTATGDVVNSINMAQPPSGRGPAEYRLVGTAARFFVANIPNRIDISNGATTMRIDNITTNIRPGRNFFDPTGNFYLFIGGRLRINANQQVGSYSGTYDVTVH